MTCPALCHHCPPAPTTHRSLLWAWQFQASDEKGVGWKYRTSLARTEEEASDWGLREDRDDPSVLPISQFQGPCSLPFWPLWLREPLPCLKSLFWDPWWHQMVGTKPLKQTGILEGREACGMDGWLGKGHEHGSEIWVLKFTLIICMNCSSVAKRGRTHEDSIASTSALEFLVISKLPAPNSRCTSLPGLLSPNTMDWVVLNSRHSFSNSSMLQLQDEVVGEIGFFWGLTLWLAGSCLLAVPPRGHLWCAHTPRLFVCPAILLPQGHIILDQGPHTGLTGSETSLRALYPSIVICWVLGVRLQHRNWRGTIQPLTVDQKSELEVYIYKKTHVSLVMKSTSDTYHLLVLFIVPKGLRSKIVDRTAEGKPLWLSNLIRGKKSSQNLTEIGIWSVCLNVADRYFSGSHPSECQAGTSNYQNWWELLQCTPLHSRPEARAQCSEESCFFLKKKMTPEVYFAPDGSLEE